MCGEKSGIVVRSAPLLGSPPRVRGKADVLHTINDDFGITPACAGKSCCTLSKACSGWDHPRVCGEKKQLYKEFPRARGSPPRVRGKGPKHLSIRQWSRITPACAGKRRNKPYCFFWPWDHPRVCGEKLLSSCVSVFAWGSPPRVRGKALVQSQAQRSTRITPACAGKRLCRSLRKARQRDHPRVCGEKESENDATATRLGSPPRVRGKD